jgi:hypothetical protein
LIRANLEALQRRERRIRPVAIGTLTDAQLAALNRERAKAKNPRAPVVAEILFVGHHVYKRRHIEDGYTIEDIADQIASALDEKAVFLVTDYMTALENPIEREDRYGNQVRDRAVLECTRLHPRPELFSVVPKGDRIKPKK